MIRLLLATLFTVGLAAGAAAQLTTSQRAEFFDACADSCTKNSPQAPCSSYCGCVTDEINKWSPAEINELGRAYESDNPHPMKTRLEQTTAVCRRRLGL